MGCRIDTRISVRCECDERIFVVSLPLTAGTDRFLIEANDGEAIHLSFDEWDALLRAVAKARSLRPKHRRNGPAAANHGLPWSADDDAALTVCWKAGDALDSLTGRFGRSEGGIAARLRRLGLIESREEAFWPVQQRRQL